MLKTIATFAALATLTATAIAPAHAWILVNGGGENGISLNGGGTNGTGDNGIIRNGGGNNGTGDNGFATNGGGTNGGGANGAESSSSTLTIQAIELPPETR